jgi:hypothetical protein
VAGIVFWTKNFAPMLARVDEMEGMGFRRWLVHYTITGLGAEWEPRVPETTVAISTLLALSERIGAERIYWRFDPMVFTKRITVAATLERFARLCGELQGAVIRCYTSEMQHYRKIELRIEDYEECHHDLMWPPTGDELIELATGLAEIGRGAGINVHSCCTPELAGFGIQPARCIDAELINRLWPDARVPVIAAPSRQGCGCHRAIDIGAYDTCPHRCLYCYANASDRTIARRHAGHHPDRPALGD